MNFMYREKIRARRTCQQHYENEYVRNSRLETEVDATVERVKEVAVMKN